MSEKVNKKLLDLSDDEPETGLKINEKFSERYENYRSKEELQRLKDKYGDQIWHSSSEEESEEDDEESEESEDDQELINKELNDESFFRVLGALKSKDEDIYDKEKRFFAPKLDSTDQKGDLKKEEVSEISKESSKKEKKMDLLNYHKKLLKEKKGVTEEDEELLAEKQMKTGIGYYEELSEIKKDLLKAAADSNKEEDDDLIVGVKVIEPKEEDLEMDPKILLKKKANEDKYIGKLSNYWKSDSLNEKEKFLRDYFVNKEYLKDNDSENEEENKNEEDEPSENEYDSDDSVQRNLVKAYEESKFHHEEKDGNIIKSFPRDIESIRDIALKQQKKTKRDEKRELKKQQKEAELRKLRELKRNEIKQKLKLVEKTSGRKLQHKMNEIDIDLLVDDTEFDPEKWDEKMSSLFNDEFYQDEDEDMSKPKFEHDSDIDDQMYEDDVDEGLLADEDEKFGKIIPIEDDDQVEDEEEEEPKMSKKQLLKQKKQAKKEKKQDLTANKNIGIYEDVIDGKGVRFRYRETTANTFGLTIEEILLADEKELNRWCSLTKSQQFTDDEQERLYFEKKGKNLALKKKILKSLYGDEEDQQKIKKLESDETSEKKKKHKKRKKNKNHLEQSEEEKMVEQTEEDQEELPKKKKKIEQEVFDVQEIKSNKNSKKKIVSDQLENSEDKEMDKEIVSKEKISLTDGKKKYVKETSGVKDKRKRVRKSKKGPVDEQRLSAYGISNNSQRKKKFSK